MSVKAPSFRFGQVGDVTAREDSVSPMCTLDHCRRDRSGPRVAPSSRRALLTLLALLTLCAAMPSRADDAAAQAFCAATQPMLDTGGSTTPRRAAVRIDGRYDGGHGERILCLDGDAHSVSHPLRRSTFRLETPRLVTTLDGTRMLEAWEEDRDQGIVRSRGIGLPSPGGWTAGPDTSVRHLARYRRGNRAPCSALPGSAACTSAIVELTELRSRADGAELVHSVWVNGAASERAVWRLER